MAILRKSALALAAMFCLAVAVPVFAQDKAATDVNAAQNTLKQMQQLNASIKARQANQTGTTPVAAPVVRTTTAEPGAKTTGKKAGRKAGAKKKKNP